MTIHTYLLALMTFRFEQISHQKFKNLLKIFFLSQTFGQSNNKTYIIVTTELLL